MLLFTSHAKESILGTKSDVGSLVYANGIDIFICIACLFPVNSTELLMFIVHEEYKF